MNRSCGICKRELEVDSDPLSLDCGGDCWGCIGEIEADGGYEPSLLQVRKEYSEGYRDNWIPSPEVTFGGSEKLGITAHIKLIRPLGNPWANETFNLQVIHQLPGAMEQVLESSELCTNEVGECKYRIESEMEESSSIWCRLYRKKQSWSFPVNAGKIA